MSNQIRKVAIVTGAARGIGKAIAQALARHDHDHAIINLREEQLAETVKVIEALGVRALPVPVDILDYQAV